MVAGGKFKSHKRYHLLFLFTVISPLTCKIGNLGIISNYSTSTCGIRAEVPFKYTRVCENNLNHGFPLFIASLEGLDGVNRRPRIDQNVYCQALQRLSFY